MRNKSIATLGLLTLLATASAFGQSSDRGHMRMDIPFEFRVGNVVMPAGQYRLYPVSGGSGSVLSIDSVSRQAHADFHTYSAADRKDAVRDKDTLGFHRYGDMYFLSTVAFAGATQYSAVAASKDERELAARTASPAETSKVLLTSR